MRLVDLFEEYVEDTKIRLRRRVLRKWNKWGRDEALTPGHLYYDSLTDEYFEVRSVGSQIVVEPKDNERDDQWSVNKETMQFALDADILYHDKRRCSRCRVIDDV